ncbi:MAG: hypothetical protein AAGA58_12890 [Verrucomicrobiota bacterium]
MSNEAHVVSIETIENFRNRLIIYVQDAKRALDEVGDSVRKTREWLNYEKSQECRMEIKKCGKKLAQAEEELYSARLQDLQAQHAAKKVQVTRARRMLDDAEQRAKKVKKWIREYDHLVEPLEKKLEGLRQMLAQDLPKGIGYLAETKKTLERYSEVGVGGGPTPVSAEVTATATESTKSEEGSEES